MYIFFHFLVQTYTLIHTFINFGLKRSKLYKYSKLNFIHPMMYLSNTIKAFALNIENYKTEDLNFELLI